MKQVVDPERVVADAVQQPVGTAPPDGTVDYTNPFWSAYTGVSGAASPGTGWTVALHPDDLEPTLARFRAAAAAGEPDEVEYRLRRYDGAYCWHLAKIAPIRDGTGAIAGRVATATDIDERTRAEAARERLLAAQRALADAGRAFAEATTDPAVLLEIVACHASAAVGDGCTVWLLDEAGERLRPVASYHPDAAVLAATRDYFARVEHETVAGLVGQAARTGASVVLPDLDPDALRERVHPAYRDLLVRFPAFGLLATPMRARGRVVGVIAVSRGVPGNPYDADDLFLLREFADRAAPAIDNARLFRAAQAAEMRYRALFEGVADAILVADDSRRYRGANAAALALLGYSRDELLARRIDDVVADESTWTAAEFERFRDAGRWRGELELRRKDGSTVPVEALATVVDPPEGWLHLAAVRDVSERRAPARRQADFLAMVSHDLRRPLTTVVGQAQLMRRRGAYSEAGVAAILSQARRMERLGSDLADVVRLEAGRLQLALAPVDLVEVAREIAAQARLQHPERNI